MRHAENLLESFFKMKRECLMDEGVSGQGVCNTGMPVGKLLSFTGLLGRFEVLILRKKVLSAGTLKGFRQSPEPVNEVEIRPQRREGIRSAADEQVKKGVSLKLPEPDGKAGEAQHQHKDKGT